MWHLVMPEKSHDKGKKKKAMKVCNLSRIYRSIRRGENSAMSQKDNTTAKGF